jgi:hypothetical protein
VSRSVPVFLGHSAQDETAHGVTVDSAGATAPVRLGVRR